MKIPGFDRVDNGTWNAEQVLHACANRLAIKHDVKLRGKNQYADTGQHAVNNGG